nr:hypothetical protein Q903MT_gene1773 [Picea sitchensis]
MHYTSWQTAVYFLYLLLYPSSELGSYPILYLLLFIGVKQRDRSYLAIALFQHPISLL